MNEEERNGLTPEVEEVIRSTVEEILEPHDETLDISYIDVAQLNSIFYGIREGIIPTIEPDSEHLYTYKLYFGNNESSILYINEHQYDMIMEAIRNYHSTQEEHNESLPDSEDSSPLSEEEEKLLTQIVEEAHSEIPTNSGSLLVDESTSRFSSAIWYEAIQKKTIILAGVGGIGSWVALLLARLKPASMFIYDNDIVEAVNMSGQLYSREDVGCTKVSALSGMISKYCDYNSVFAVPEKFDESNDASDIMICGFDNMTARKIFFNKWLDHVRSKSEAERANCLYIDGRLAAEEFQVLCIKGDDEFNINRYEKEFLFSDIEADATICSYKQTTFMANMIASVMVNLFVNFVANQCKPLIDRDLPFYTTYSAETMYYKTEA